jgi:hypothetical protein
MQRLGTGRHSGSQRRREPALDPPLATQLLAARRRVAGATATSSVRLHSGAQRPRTSLDIRRVGDPTPDFDRAAQNRVTRSSPTRVTVWFGGTPDRGRCKATRQKPRLLLPMRGGLSAHRASGGGCRAPDETTKASSTRWAIVSLTGSEEVLMRTIRLRRGGGASRSGSSSPPTRYGPVGARRARKDEPGHFFLEPPLGSVPEHQLAVACWRVVVRFAASYRSMRCGGGSGKGPAPRASPAAVLGDAKVTPATDCGALHAIPGIGCAASGCVPVFPSSPSSRLELDSSDATSSTRRRSPARRQPAGRTELARDAQVGAAEPSIRRSC